MAKANNTGKVIGTVSGLNGKATAISPNGDFRFLKNGDKVFENEKVTAHDGSSVHIDLTGPGFATIGAGDSVTFDASLLSDASQAGKANAAASEPAAVSDVEIEALQAKIAAGADPSEVTEAAAAGPQSAAGAADEGSGFVIVSQNATQGEVTPGFGTDSLSLSASGEIHTPILYSTTTDSGNNENSGGGGSIPSPGENNDAYIRAVLYNGGSSTDPVTTSIFYSDGSGRPVALNPAEINYQGSNPSARYSAVLSIPEGWNQSWVKVTFNAVTGRFEFTLTPEGIAEMNQLGLSGKYLVDFVHVTVTDTLNPGKPAFGYNVQVVGSNNPDFNSHDQDALDQSEAYPNHNQESIGEFHQGKDQSGPYNVISSNNDDEITLNDTVIGDSHIHASGSDDPAQMADDYNTILLNKGMNNTAGDTFITSTDGKLTAKEGVLATGSTASNSIDMGKGEIHIGNAAGNGVTANDGGKNTITGGKITVEGAVAGVNATNGGQNEIIGKNGADITIKGDGANASGVVASSGGQNVISTEDGTITIEGSRYGLQANHQNSYNKVSVENGDIHITGNDKYALYAYLNSKNEVSATGGNIDISGRGGLQATNAAINEVSLEGSGTISITSKDYVAMSAGLHNASNILTAKDGSVRITAEGIAMQASEGKNTITSEQVTIKSGGNAMNAHIGGNNTITGRDIDITADATGVFAQDGGVNTINGIGGTISIKGATGVEASKSGSTTSNIGGSNVISTDGGTIEIEGNSGVVASASGKNQIIGEGNANITITGQKEAGVAATGTESSNTVKGQNINITGTTTGVLASDGGSNNITGTTGGTLNIQGSTGVISIDGGKNQIIGEGNANMTITGQKEAGIAAAGTGSINTVKGQNINITGNTTGVLASDGGSNNITGTTGGTLNIQGSTGVTSIDGGKNQIIGEGNANITITGQKEAGVAVAGTGSINTVKGQNINITGNTTGVLASDGGSNTITGTTGGTLNIQGNTGVTASDGGKNQIIGEGNANITITGQKEAGVFASGTGSSNAVMVNNINITGKTTGVLASDGSSNNINGIGSESTVNIQGQTGAGVVATGVKSSNAVAGKYIDITGDTTGLLASDGGKNRITASTGGTLHIEGKTGAGMTATDTSATGVRSENVLKGNSMDITGKTSGLLASGGNLNQIDSTAGTVNITGKEGAGITATGTSNTGTPSYNLVNGIDINITGKTSGVSVSGGRNSINSNGGTVNITGQEEAGMIAIGKNSNNSASGKNVNITGDTTGLLALDGGRNGVTGTTGGTVNIQGNEEAGVAAIGGNSSNIVNSDSIHITGKTSGVLASDGGQNTIKSGTNGTIEIEGKNGVGIVATGRDSKNTVGGVDTTTIKVTAATTGVLASDGGTNQVSSSKTIIITATADAAEKAIALWADGKGSVNYISSSSPEGSNIIVTANNGSGIAMLAENGGKNIITTGAGDDRVTINGDVKGSGNEINVGGGNNTVTLNGMIEPGSLNVMANSNGTYTLILQAADNQSFIAQYGSWLTALNAQDWWTSGMKSIKFDGLDINDLTDFLTMFNDLLWNMKQANPAFVIEPPELEAAIYDPAIGPHVIPLALPVEVETHEAAVTADTPSAQHSDNSSADGSGNANLAAAASGIEQNVSSESTALLPENDSAHLVVEALQDEMLSANEDTATSLADTADTDIILAETDDSNLQADQQADAPVIMDDIIGENAIELGDGADSSHPGSGYVEETTVESEDILHLSGEHAISSLTDNGDSGNTLDSLTTIDLRDNDSDDILHLDAVLTGLGGALDGEVTGSTDLSELINASDSVLLVNKDAGDQVVLENDIWEAQGAVAYNGASYDVYHNSSNEYVLVQQDQVHTGPF